MKTETQRKGNLMATSNLVKIALLSAIAIILMQLEMSTGIFPSFLKIELSDVPAIIGSFSFGPLAGVLIELIKNVLKLTTTKTGGIGELANFIVGVAYVVPVGFIYKKYNGKFKMLLSFTIATITMTVIACLMNYFVLIPLYANLFGGMENVVGAAAIAMPAIKDFITLILIGIAPFNVLKGIVMSVVSYYLYKVIKNRL